MKLCKYFFVLLIFISFNLYGYSNNGEKWEDYTKEELQELKETNAIKWADLYNDYSTRELEQEEQLKKEQIKKQAPNFLNVDKVTTVLLDNTEEENCSTDILSLSAYIACIQDNEDIGKFAGLGDYENYKWSIFQSTGNNQSLLIFEDYADGLIIVDGIKGFDNQSLKNKYYILEYTGTKQYTNPLGSIKSVPSFKVIKEINIKLK